MTWKDKMHSKPAESENRLALRWFYLIRDLVFLYQSGGVVERTFSQSQQEGCQLLGRAPGIRELVPRLEERPQDGGLPQTTEAACNPSRKIPTRPGEWKVIATEVNNGHGEIRKLFIHYIQKLNILRLQSYSSVDCFCMKIFCGVFSQITRGSLWMRCSRLRSRAPSHSSMDRGMMTTMQGTTLNRPQTRLNKMSGWVSKCPSLRRTMLCIHADKTKIHCPWFVTLL